MNETIQMMASEPGFWVIIGLPIFALFNLLASLRQQAASRQLMTELDDLVGGRELNAYDKALLTNILPDKNSSVLKIAAVFAPVLFIASIATSLAESWRDRSSGNGTKRNSLPGALGDVDALISRSIEQESGLDPIKSGLWNDPRREKLSYLSRTIEFWESPLSAAWLGMWLILALPGIALIYLLSGTTRYFVQNIMQPLQVSVALSLKLLKLST
jgi:hypothetical protein